MYEHIAFLTAPAWAFDNDPHVAQLWSASTNFCSFCGERVPHAATVLFLIFSLNAPH